MNMRREGLENLSFADALKQEEDRRANNGYLLWRYRDMGRYYSQLQPYLNSFPREQLMIVTFDFLLNSTGTFLSDLFEFLEIRNDIQVDTRRIHNRAGEVRLRGLYDWMIRPNSLRRAIGRFIPDRIRWGMRDVLRDWNVKSKTPMPEDCRRSLLDYYLPEIEKLENCFGWDLSNWKRDPDFLSSRRK